MLPLASFVQRSAWETLKRFPGPLLAAAVAGALLVDAQHHDFRGQDPLMFVLAAGLGIPVGTALTLLAEHPPSWLARLPARSALAFGLTSVVVVAYALVLHNSRGQGEAYVLRYAQLSLAAHLAVSFAPFVGGLRRSTADDDAARTRGVWQLGRQLFLRLPLSGVYALVVFGGLALALGATVHLFEVKVDEDRYFELWVFCVFILQTWHFLAGIPRDFTALENDETYPRGLRIFAQFVLLPLLGLYLVILYAYAGKISLSASLPSGWVGWMVSAAGGFGMLSLLLLFPAREGASGRFVRAVETVFHVAILPLLVLLFVSLGERIGAYGITERRYFLLILGAWLGVASIYRLRWGRRTLAWIPASLCLVALATSVGPWSALSVSRASQSARLTALLEDNDRLSGPAKSAPAASIHDEREISRILDYLIDTHGKQVLRDWPGAQKGVDTAHEFMRVRGLGYVERYGGTSDAVDFSGRADHPIDVRGYDWLLHFDAYAGTDTASPVDRFGLRLSQDEAALQISEDGKPRAKIPLSTVVERLRSERLQGKGNIDPVVVDTESDGWRFRLVLTHLRAEPRGEGWTIQSAGGHLLIGERGAPPSHSAE